MRIGWIVAAACAAVLAGAAAAPAAGEDPGLLRRGLARELQPDDQHHRDHLQRQLPRSTAASSSSAPARPRCSPGWPRSGKSRPTARVFTFHLRHNVKWQSNKNFTPTRDFNADDVIFSFERQWKDSNPVPQGLGRRTIATSATWASPSCWCRIDKVDDYTVRFTLKQPQAPFLADLAMDFASIQSKEYADALLKTRQARADRPGADRHRPVRVGQPTEGQPPSATAPSRATGAPKPHDRHRWCSPSRRTRRCGWPSCAPTSARSWPIRTRPTCRRSARTRTCN